MYINKIEKQSIPNVMILFTMVKSMLKRFGFNKPSSGLYNGEKNTAGITLDVFDKDKWKRENIYSEKPISD